MAVRDLSCTIDGCSNPQVGKGLCSKHWQRVKFHGDPHHTNKQGQTKTQEYRHWQRMNERCYSPNHRSYEHYHGNGITVCDRWRGRGGFFNFLADMGTRPSPGHTIDRIDTRGPYSPDNCRWATATEQSNNRGDYNVRLEVNGETKTVAEWSRVVGISTGVIRTRLERGWPHEAAVLTPTRSKRDRHLIRKSSAKLTEDDVMAIRASDLGPKELSLKYGVSRSHITSLRSGRFWEPLPKA